MALVFRFLPGGFLSVRGPVPLLCRLLEEGAAGRLLVPLEAALAADVPLRLEAAAHRVVLDRGLVTVEHLWRPVSVTLPAGEVVAALRERSAFLAAHPRPGSWVPGGVVPGRWP